jgi:hypothetical protein
MFTRPNTITEKAKLAGTLNISSLIIGLGIIWLGNTYVAEYIYPPLKIYFLIFLPVLTIFWLAPSFANHGESNLITYLHLMKRDRSIYSPESYQEMEWEIDDY